MTAKERLLQFVESQFKSKREFYRQTGLSNGSLNAPKSIGSEVLEKIASTFPHLNFHWIITGNGEMLVNAETDLGWDNVFDDEKLKLLQNKGAALEKELALKNELLELYRAQTAKELNKSKIA